MWRHGFDAGGSNGNYPNDANDTWTICPDVVDEIITVTFNSFNIENNGSDCFDQLTIHDGDDTSDPVIPSPGGTTTGWCFDQDDMVPSGSGDLTGMSITSTDPSGCLTFVFESDNAGSRSGWSMTIQCTQPLVFTPSSGNQGSVTDFVIMGFGTNFSTDNTTCVELSKDATTYTIDGTASSANMFSGSFDIPLDAPTGFYNATVFEGPGCASGFALAVWNCITCFRVLPPFLSVEWLSFEASKNGDEIDLRWVTATELNSDYFEIERSPDGETWSVIGRENASGTTSSERIYTFTDESPLRNFNYYRIKQADLDGGISYSSIEAVRFGSDQTGIEIFPNPVFGNATAVLSSTLKEDINIYIHDISGKLVKQIETQVEIGTNTLEWNLQDLPEGIFFIQIESGQNWKTVRFSKL